MQVANSLDFGFVPVKEVLTQPLVVKNTGDVKVREVAQYMHA